MNHRSIGTGPRVDIKTSYGSVIVDLYANKSPITVANFLTYVEDSFYENTLFHRVIDNFLVQGGGYDPGLIQKTTRLPIQNEADNGLRNDRGSLSMARLDEDPHSATAQFFINTADNDLLNYGKTESTWGYCVFGAVRTGMKVIERIEGIPTMTRNSHHNVPIQPVIINKIIVLPN